MTDVYIDDKTLDPDFMTRLAWNYKDEKVNYHFKHDDWLLPCFPFEKRAKYLTKCKNIPVDNLFIAVYDL